MTRRVNATVLWTGVVIWLVSSGAGFAQRGGPGFPPGGFGGGPMQQELKIVDQFDKDGDGILNADERKAAKAYLESLGTRGMRGFGGRGMGPTTAAPGARISPKDVATYPNATLFDPSVLRTFFLTFEDSDWQDQLMIFKNTDVDVPATLVIDGKTYRDVGVHFHGSSSFSMVPEGLKHSIAIKLDFVHPDQEIGDQHSLLLLNSAEDATFLRSMLYYQAARDYLPAPKANYARVAINGESWGPYVHVQHYTKDFIRDWFNTTAGARWKVPGNPGARGGLEYLGDDVEQYKRHYDIKSKDDPKSWADFINLCKVLNETPPNRLEAALAPIFDVDQALRFIAIDNVLVNDDGYWTRSSDYSIYQDTKGKFHVFPWDANETFAGDEIGGSTARGGGPPGFGGPGPGRGRGGPGGVGGFGGGRGGGGATLDPLVGLDDPAKPLRSKLLAVPALRAKYMADVREIATKWLDWKTLGPLATRYQALIADDVKKDTKKLDTVEEFTAAVDAMQTFANARRQYLLAYQDTTAAR